MLLFFYLSLKGDKKTMLKLISAAIDNKRDAGHKYLLDGDLEQMSMQKRFLQDNGFEVGQVNCYPALKTEEEFKKALLLFWEKRIKGWWNYEKSLIKYGVCTQEEFNQVLGRK